MKIEWKKKKGGVVMKYERLTRGARDIFFFFFLFCSFIFVGFFSLLLLFFFSSPAPFFFVCVCVCLLCLLWPVITALTDDGDWWQTQPKGFFLLLFVGFFCCFFLGGFLRSLVGRRIGLGNKTRRKRFGSCFFLVFFWFVGWFCLAVDRIDVSIQMKEKSIIWWSSSILIRNPK